MPRGLRPRPGRLADTMRLVVFAVVVAEIFRIPEPDVCAHVGLYGSQTKRAPTVRTAVVVGRVVVQRPGE